MTEMPGARETASSLFTMQRLWVASCAFSFLLLCARVTVTGQLTYVFLLWNLGLAFIPYLLTLWIYDHPSVITRKWLLGLLLTGWLLFIPNSFYLLTDLFHLGRNQAAPKWFDLLLLLSFAWNGLLAGIESFRKIELILQRFMGRGLSLVYVFILMCLVAYGIYLGRFLRYNSWDMITHPFRILGDALGMILHPFENKMEWGMIFCYATFMTILYTTIKKLAGNFGQTSH
jgi:uncharacterized membrane protein